jgi:hypothetical protein
MHKQNKRHKDDHLGQGNILFYSIFKDWKLQALQVDALQTWSELLLTLLQVHLPNSFSHNLLITPMEEKGLYGRKGLEREC